MVPILLFVMEVVRACGWHQKDTDYIPSRPHWILITAWWSYLALMTVFIIVDNLCVCPE